MTTKNSPSATPKIAKEVGAGGLGIKKLDVTTHSPVTNSPRLVKDEDEITVETAKNANNETNKKEEESNTSSESTDLQASQTSGLVDDQRDDDLQQFSFGLLKQKFHTQGKEPKTWQSHGFWKRPAQYEENLIKKEQGGEKWLNMKRRVYTQTQLDARYPDTTPPVTVCQRLKNEYRCSKQKLMSYFPIISVLKKYEWRQDLLSDVTAGVSTSFLQMPMGMALALLAHLPPIIGLYSSFFPVIIYVIFGTSRHICMGTQALVSLLTASVVDRKLNELKTAQVDDGVLSEADEFEYKICVATSVAFISGMILLSMGLLRFGFVTTYLSSSFLGGFTFAAAIHIVTSQLPPLFNIVVAPQQGAFRVIRYYKEISPKMLHANVVDASIGIGSTLILLIVGYVNEKYQNKMPLPIPIHLILVVIATVASTAGEFQANYKIAVVGDVPVGFKIPAMPQTNIMGDIFKEAFLIAVMIFALTIAMAKLMSKQHNYQIDDNQELVAYGLCNAIGAFFWCQPNSTAPPRTMLLNLCRVRTTVNGVFLSAFLFLVIVAAGPLFAQLPVSVLAAMIIATIKGLLMQVTQVPKLWRVSKPDFTVWVVTCLVGVFIDLDYAILVGVAISIMSVIVFNQIVPATVGGISVTEHVILLNKKRNNIFSFHEVALFYFPSQLYFANAEKFKRDIYTLILDPDVIGDPKQYDDAHCRTKSMMALNSDINYFYHDKEHFPVRKFSKGFPVQSHWQTESDCDNELHCELHLKESAQEPVPLQCSKTFPDEHGCLQAIIIDCSAITYIDVAGLNILELVMSRYDDIGIKVYLAECSPYFLKTLRKSHFRDRVPDDCIAFKISDALYRCGEDLLHELFTTRNIKYDDVYEISETTAN